jgi:hypothetical protein
MLKVLGAACEWVTILPSMGSNACMGRAMKPDQALWLLNKVDERRQERAKTPAVRIRGSGYGWWTKRQMRTQHENSMYDLRDACQHRVHKVLLETTAPFCACSISSLSFALPLPLSTSTCDLSSCLPPGPLLGLVQTCSSFYGNLSKSQLDSIMSYGCMLCRN